MKASRQKALLVLLLGGAFLLLSSQASALNESASVYWSAKPMKGKFKKSAALPAKLSWGVRVAAGEGEVTILPIRTATMQFPRNMKFAPSRSLRACTYSEPQLVGPAPTIYNRCPNSIVGNGEATFQLGQSTSPLAYREGTVVILYGGRSRAGVLLRFSAWSQDTGAGVVADGRLLSDGKMEVDLPVLTADSAVTSLDLHIPGKTVNGTWASGGEYSLRPGSDKKFVRVRCGMGQKTIFRTSLLLGARNPSSGQPYGPERTLQPTATSRCGR